MSANLSRPSCCVFLTSFFSLWLCFNLTSFSSDVHSQPLFCAPFNLTADSGLVPTSATISEPGWCRIRTSPLSAFHLRNRARFRRWRVRQDAVSPHNDGESRRRVRKLPASHRTVNQFFHHHSKCLRGHRTLHYFHKLRLLRWEVVSMPCLELLQTSGSSPHCTTTQPCASSSPNDASV